MKGKEGYWLGRGSARARDCNSVVPAAGGYSEGEEAKRTGTEGGEWEVG